MSSGRLNGKNSVQSHVYQSVLLSLCSMIDPNTIADTTVPVSKVHNILFLKPNSSGKSNSQSSIGDSRKFTLPQSFRCHILRFDLVLFAPNSYCIEWEEIAFTVSINPSGNHLYRIQVSHNMFLSINLYYVNNTHINIFFNIHLSKVFDKCILVQ